ncbi:MAG: ComF family protein [Chloroflexota bacterium]
MSILRRASTFALDIAFPPRCLGCGDSGVFICEDCFAEAPHALPANRCLKCWNSNSALRCASCARFDLRITALRSAFSYEGIALDTVHAFKFDSVSALAPAMAEPMVDVLNRWSPPVDVVVPVPLAWGRRRSRGYNQAELLAREVCRATGLRLDAGVLRRARQTAPQSLQPSEEARRRNVASAFAPGRHAVSGAVLLIDDVATTGATLDACAGVLLARGADAVYALTFARED